MQVGGVQKQGEALGFQPMTAEARAGKAIFDTLKEQEVAIEAASRIMAQASEALLEERQEHYATMGKMREYRDALEALVEWGIEQAGLGDVSQREETEIPTPLALALAVLADAADEIATAGPTCPECVQGKHENCTVDVLAEDDAPVLCGCGAGGHDR